MLKILNSTKIFQALSTLILIVSPFLYDEWESHANIQKKAILYHSSADMLIDPCS